MRKRWLVVSNCQTFGLTHCLQSLGRDVDVDPCDFWEFQRTVQGDPGRLARYDLGLVLHEGYHLPEFRDDLFPRHRKLPVIEFGGYHPDCCYVMADGTMIGDGVAGPYHSLIVLAAYQEGLGVAKTVGWFAPRTYEALGYFDQWRAQRDVIVAGFTDLGFDIAPLFRTAGRGRSFMHTFDHPNILALFEMAKAILRSEGEAMFEHITPPPDALAGTVWPVYPEIGERLGVAGAYLFKPTSEHRPLELADFVERSLASFARWPGEHLTVPPPVARRLTALRAMMRAER